MPAPVTTTPVSLANAPTGTPTTVITSLVHTTQQEDARVPSNQWRLADDVAANYRHPGSPVSIIGTSPSAQITGIPSGTLDSLVSAEMSRMLSADRDYNTALVRVDGVLTRGSGLHDATFAATSITSAGYDERPQR